MRQAQLFSLKGIKKGINGVFQQAMRNEKNKTEQTFPDVPEQRNNPGKRRYSPCRKPSASLRFPNSHAFSRPCSDRSMLFMLGTSGAGARLTREAIRTGSVSRMMPSSMISSTARATRS